jgi:nucleoside-diphosphate-sugar epimerase
MRILLTGSSGYLGTVLTEALAQCPEVDTITGLDIVPPLTPLPAKARCVLMDMRSAEVYPLMVGHDVVIHTAFVVLWPACMPVAERDDINLNGVRNVAQAAVAANVQHVIQASSIVAYDPDQTPGQKALTEDFPLSRGDSPFYYANGKAEAERTLEQVLTPAGIRLTIFRPCYIIGPLNRVTVQSFRDHPGRVWGRNPRLQFIHESDVAAAFIQALRTGLPGSYNLVPDDALRWDEVLRLVGIRLALPVPLPVAHLFTMVAWRYFGSPTHPAWLLYDLLDDFTASNARLRATGWQPGYTSEAALRTAL